MVRARLLAHFQAMLCAYGPQHWWPGETAFEIMVGAVLTQNTAWTNVERALERLARRIPLEADVILSLPKIELAECLHPVGYFNVKTERLRSFCAAYLDSGGLAGLARMPTTELRHHLLSIQGVGPETADDILLYAFERPVFVVDAYTRRIFTRLGELHGRETYETVRHAVEQALGEDQILFGEYHALIVRHGKDVCRSRPRCGECCLRGSCTFPNP